MKYAVFNRVRNELAKDNEPYVIEFDHQIEFLIDEDGRTHCDEYNIVFEEEITPPQRFYEAVLKAFLKLNEEGKLQGCKVYTRDSWDDTRWIK